MLPLGGMRYVLPTFTIDLRPLRGLGEAARLLPLPITIVAGESTCPVVADAPSKARDLAGVFYKYNKFSIKDPMLDKFCKVKKITKINPGLLLYNRKNFHVTSIINVVKTGDCIKIHD